MARQQMVKQSFILLLTLLLTSCAWTPQSVQLASLTQKWSRRGKLLSLDV